MCIRDSICPTNALTMVSQESQAAQQEVFDYMVASVSVKEDMADLTVKGLSLIHI